MILKKSSENLERKRYKYNKQLIYMEKVVIVMEKMRERCLVLKDFLQRKRIHI